MAEKKAPAPKFTVLPNGGVRLGALKLRATTWAQRMVEQDFCRTPLYVPGARCDIAAIADHIASDTVLIILVRHLGGFDSEREAADAIDDVNREFGSLQLGMALGEAIRQSYGGSDGKTGGGGDDMGEA